MEDRKVNHVKHIDKYEKESSLNEKDFKEDKAWKTELIKTKIQI